MPWNNRSKKNIFFQMRAVTFDGIVRFDVSSRKTMSPQEFNQYIDEYSDAIFRFLLKQVRNEELARDIIQDSLEKLWRNRNQVMKDKVKSWLFTTAYHGLIDAIRKDKKRLEYEKQFDSANVDSRQYTDLNEVLHKALETLPEIQKTVVLLRDYEGYSYDEIGEICNLSEAQVKVYIYRARVGMKKYIGKLETVL